MARILCIADNLIQVERFADMLKRRGHESVDTMIPPLDLNRVDAFAPEIVVVHLVRKVATLRSPIANFYAEVEGARVLPELKAHWGENSPALILTGIAVEEADLPADLCYAAFVDVPRQLDRLLVHIEAAVLTQR